MVLEHIRSQASANSSTNLLLVLFVPSISPQVRLSLMLTERFSSSWFIPTRSPNSSSYYLLTYLPSSIFSYNSFEPGVFEDVPISRAVSLYEASYHRRCLLASANFSYQLSSRRIGALNLRLGRGNRQQLLSCVSRNGKTRMLMSLPFI